MSRSSVNLLIFLAIMLPLSCEDLGTESPEDTNSLLPLTIGNTWEYVDSLFLANDSVHVHHYTWSVVGKTTIFTGGDSLQVCIFRIRFPDGNSYDYFYRNNPDGLTRYLPYYSDGDRYLKTLLVKYPMHVGDTWKEDQGDYYNLLRCVSTDTPIATNWRVFHCYQVRYDSPYGGGYEDSFYSYRFGQVAGFARHPGWSSKRTLVSFVVR